MKTTLEYIDEVANSTASKPKARQNEFAGFRFREVTETLSENAKTYAKDREALRGRLSKIGVEPLAMVPLAWWNDVLKKSDLVVTDASDRGMVGFTSQTAREIVTAAKSFMAFSFLASMILAFVGTASLSYFAGGNPLFVGQQPAMILGLLTTMGFGIALGIVSFLLKKVFFRIAVAFVIASYGRNLIRDKMKFGDVGNCVCDYLLPTPTPEAAEVLTKLNNNTRHGKASWDSNGSLFYTNEIGIAAIPEAFSLSVSPVQMVCDWEADRAIRDAEARALAARLDPIVYVTSGKAVAIVAQFGDFPIEKEIVDQAVQADL